MSISKKSERRADNRVNVCLPVEMSLDSGEKFTLCTRDISTTGVFLEKGKHELPPVGTIVNLKLTQQLGMGDAPVVRAKIVRETEEGIGVLFIQE